MPERIRLGSASQRGSLRTHRRARIGGRGAAQDVDDRPTDLGRRRRRGTQEGVGRRELHLRIGVTQRLDEERWPSGRAGRRRGRVAISSIAQHLQHRQHKRGLLPVDPELQQLHERAGGSIGKKAERGWLGRCEVAETGSFHGPFRRQSQHGPLRGFVIRLVFESPAGITQSVELLGIPDRHVLDLRELLGLAVPDPERNGGWRTIRIGLGRGEASRMVVERPRRRHQPGFGLPEVEFHAGREALKKVFRHSPHRVALVARRLGDDLPEERRDPGLGVGLKIEDVITTRDGRDHACLLFLGQAVECRDPALNGVALLDLDRAQDPGIEVVVAGDTEFIDHEGDDEIAHPPQLDFREETLFVSCAEVGDVLGDPGGIAKQLLARGARTLDRFLDVRPRRFLGGRVVGPFGDRAATARTRSFRTSSRSPGGRRPWGWS